MSGRGERLFAILLRLYPRAFRERYRHDLLAFFRADRTHPKYGAGPLRPVRFWAATTRDLARAAWRARAADASGGAVPSSQGGVVSRFRSDVRSAWRSLWFAPGVTIAALVVLTLGIGAGTAIFSVVDAVTLRGLPFPAADRLMTIEEIWSDGSPWPAAAPNYLDWRARQTAFESLGASANAGRFTATDLPGEPRYRVVFVTASLFDALRVDVARGRRLQPSDEDAGAPKVALISDALWRERFSARPDVVGQRMAFENGEWEVIGVMPPGFTYPIGSVLTSSVDFWIPFTASPRDTDRGGGRTYNRTVVGRLHDGETLTRAADEMQRIRDALAADHPRWFDDVGIAVRPLQDAVVGPQVRAWMLFLLGAVGLVLLIACLNVANLLVARATARRRELALRAALGATRWDIARTLLIESLLLSAAGAACGVIASFWGVDLLRSALPENLPRMAAIAVDLRVLGVTAGVTLATALVFGTLPAWHASRPDVAAALREGGRGQAGGAGHRLRTGLVLAEVALAVVLLAGAGLFIASFARVLRIDLGFDPTHVAAVGLSPRVEGIDDPVEARARSQALMLAAAERVGQLPGVVAATVVGGGMPLSGSSMTVPAQIPGRDRPPFTGPDEPFVHAVGPEYLDVVRGDLIRGRWLADSDVAGAPKVAVLSDDAARRFFEDRDPIGQILLLDDDPHAIVGVVRSMRHSGPEGDLRPAVYEPYLQSEQGGGSIAMRAATDPAPLVPQMQEAIRSAVGSVTLYDPQTLDGLFSDLVAQRRFNMLVLSLFGALAVAIAAVGVYGLMAFLVAQRTREIGVRLALGAVPGGIVRMVLGRASRLMLGGLVLGLAGALLLERLVRAFLFRAEPYDPLVYGAVALVLLGAGLAAAFAPARRAARVDPLVALRSE